MEARWRFGRQVRFFALQTKDHCRPLRRASSHALGPGPGQAVHRPLRFRRLSTYFHQGRRPHRGEPEGVPPLPALPRLTGHLARHTPERHVQGPGRLFAPPPSPVSRSILIRRMYGRPGLRSKQDGGASRLAIVGLSEVEVASGLGDARLGATRYRPRRRQRVLPLRANHVRPRHPRLDHLPVPYQCGSTTRSN